MTNQSDLIKNEVVKKKRPKGLLISAFLGIFSLYFSILALYSVILLYFGFESYSDRISVASMLFSIILFSLISIACGLIGFLKAKIITKSGEHATTGLVLSFFGVIISSIEFIIGFVSLFVI